MRVVRAGALIVAGGLALAGAIQVSGDVAGADRIGATRWGTRAGVTTIEGEDAAVPAGTTTIVVNEPFTDDIGFVDVGKMGDSLGDYVVFHDPLTDLSGKKVGDLYVQCISGFADQCRGSLLFHGRGQVIFDGITPLGVDPDTFGVTAGTWKFSNVSGVMKVSFPADDHARIELRLKGVQS